MQGEQLEFNFKNNKGEEMENIITPEARAHYPNVIEPRENQLNGKMEYSITLLFKKGEDLKALEAAVEEAIEKKWGKARPKNLRMPIRDQLEREKTNEDGSTYLPEGYEEGAMFINAKTKDKPGVVRLDNSYIDDPAEVYSGCWVKVSLRPYAYDAAGNKGVAFGLQNVQKRRDDEPLTGRIAADNEFTAAAGSADDI